MADMGAVLFLLLVMHCGKSSAGSLTLTKMTTNAILGEPFLFRCDTRGPWEFAKTGTLNFKLNASPTCDVRRTNCMQLNPSDQEISCACVNPSDGPISFFLNITELRNDNLGPWLCEYLNKSNTITLEPTDPTGPDSTTISPADPLIVVEKHNLTLTCSAECVPECTYTWLKVKDDLDVEAKYTGSSSLVLTSVTPETEGNYTCVAVNPASRKSEMVSVEVKVNSFPRLDTAFPFTGRVQTAVGREETLRVPLRSSPSPSLTWSRVQGGNLQPVRAGELESSMEVTDERSVYSATLHMTVEEGDLGLYCLTASNYVGQSSVYIQLVEEEYPRLDTAFPFIGRVQTAVGREETLRVPIRSSPSPSLTWSRVQGGNLQPVRAGELESSMEVTDERSLYSATLHMTVEEGDLGLYCLTASNYVGQSSVYIELVEEDQDEKTLSFELGLAVGSGGTFVIALLVAFLGYWKHRQIRRALEHPYSSTANSHLESHRNSAVESHYQELPAPNMYRKLGEKMKDPDDLDDMDLSPIYNVVSEKDNEDPKRECCVSVVMGKSLINPMYGSVVMGKSLNNPMYGSVIGKSLNNPMYGSVNPDLLYPSGGTPI